MKPLVIHHASCADGFGAAFAVWLKLGDEAEYLPMQYSNTSPDMRAEKCRILGLGKTGVGFIKSN